MKIKNLIQNKKLILTLIILNIAGILYSIFVDYSPQLSQTPKYLWLFVIDCPLHMIFFAAALILILKKRDSQLLITLAFISLIKYSIYALSANIFLSASFATISYALFWAAAHILMGLQAFILLPKLKPKAEHLIITSAWLLINDFSDYFLGTASKINLINMTPLIPIAIVLSVALPVVIYVLKKSSKPACRDAI